MTLILEARGLSRHYLVGGERVQALDRVSVRVERGEFVAVMGPSGSGKSTLLHLLGLVDQPDSGEIILAGQSTAQLNDDELTRLRRDKLGFVFQSFELIPTLSARENILLPAEIAGERSAAQVRLEHLSEQLGIGERLTHRPNELSGGQRQRVALARALINDPVLLLADEPTGNLDTATGETVLELLKTGVVESGWTVIMVTHDPYAAEYANRTLQLRDGRIYQDTDLSGH